MGLIAFKMRGELTQMEKEVEANNRLNKHIKGMIKLLKFLNKQRDSKCTTQFRSNYAEMLAEKKAAKKEETRVVVAEPIVEAAEVEGGVHECGHATSEEQYDNTLLCGIIHVMLVLSILVAMAWCCVVLLPASSAVATKVEHPNEMYLHTTKVVPSIASMYPEKLAGYTSEDETNGDMYNTILMLPSRTMEKIKEYPVTTVTTTATTVLVGGVVYMVKDKIPGYDVVKQFVTNFGSYARAAWDEYTFWQSRTASAVLVTDMMCKK